jgi:hypothetical protein
MGPADPAAPTGARRSPADAVMQVRASDLEPYIGLRYLSKLFRLLAIILVLVLVAEVITGLVRYGTETIPTLVAEASRLIVFAALLWGVGDLAILLIDVGHDIRATRILLGRQAAHHVVEPQHDRWREESGQLQVASRADVSRPGRIDSRQGAR